jgi:glucose/arabinose dehydrogenase
VHKWPTALYRRACRTSAMLFALTLALALLAAGLPRAARAQCFPAGSLAFRSPVTTAPGLSAQVLANNLTTPRGLALDGAGHVLLVERGLGVSAFAEGADGCAGWRRSLVVNNSAFTQGIQVVGTALYVSTSAQVLRYEYDAATRTVASGAPVVVVSGIPPDGGLCASACGVSRR